MGVVFRPRQVYCGMCAHYSPLFLLPLPLIHTCNDNDDDNKYMQMGWYHTRDLSYNTRDWKQRRHSVNHYGNKVKGVPKCRERGLRASTFHYWCFWIWFENSKRFMNVSFGLSSQATTITMTLYWSAHPLCQMMMTMMLWAKGWGFLHIQCLEKCCSHLPREGCAFSMNQFTFAKVKLQQLPARQHSPMSACKAIPQRSPQAGRGGRRPQRPSIPIECGKSCVLRMNEEAWEPRGGNDSIWRKVAFSLGFQEWRGVSGKEAVHPQTRVLKGSRWLNQKNGGWGWYHASRRHYWAVQVWLCEEQEGAVRGFRKTFQRAMLAGGEMGSSVGTGSEGYLRRQSWQDLRCATQSLFSG